MVHMNHKYGEGKGDIEGTGSNGEELQMPDDARQPMSRVVLISSSHLTPYRVVIILRLIILGFFLQYRCTHPVKDTYPLWLTFVICEVWFAFSWLLDQFLKRCLVDRDTFLERLALRYVSLCLNDNAQQSRNYHHRIRVSAVLINGACLLNVDCDHCWRNSV
ncbi:hypothetical protein ACS0TY_032452 [Phlomoides rotata]